MIRKILIANRGEIAVRIIRACRDLHIGSVAIYTKPDVDCLHVKIADEAYEVSTDALKGYLDAKKIVEVAKECGADAIHPKGSSPAARQPPKANSEEKGKTVAARNATAKSP